jgi:hypothetical protein
VPSLETEDPGLGVTESANDLPLARREEVAAKEAPAPAPAPAALVPAAETYRGAAAEVETPPPPPPPPAFIESAMPRKNEMQAIAEQGLKESRDMNSVKIRKHCAGRDTAHLMPESFKEGLREDDWLSVPSAELDKQYKVQCTKCFFTFDITREDAERQQKEMCVTVDDTNALGGL